MDPRAEAKHSSQHGREAINYFDGHGQYADRRKFPVCALVLLDLKLPLVPGIEVLRHSREVPEWEEVPVIVFSSSNQESDIEEAYRLGAAGYIVKPDYRELIQVVHQLKKYWLDMDGPPAGCRDWLEITVPPPALPPRRWVHG